jgi:anti-sigma factor RsiW
MNRRCKESVPLIGPYLDGELADEDRTWLEEHLESCADLCRDRMALLAAQGEAIRERAAANAAGADLSRVADSVFVRIDQDRPRAPFDQLAVWGSEMWRAHHGALSAGAGLAALACVAIAVLLAPPRSDVPADAAAIAAQSTSVDEVDFENAQGALLQAGTTTVIWLSDSPVRT